MQPTLLILAAGMASRYGSMKQTEGFGPNDETIMEYSLYDAIRTGFKKAVFVIRREFADDFKKLIEPKFKDKIAIEYVYQELSHYMNGFQIPGEREKPWGTAHAVLCGKEVIHEPFAVINADDFYGRDPFERAKKFLVEECNEKTFAIIGYDLLKTLSENGTVNRGVCEVDGSGNLTSITERINIALKGDKIVCDDDKEPKELPVTMSVSMNFWCFHPSVFPFSEKMFHKFLAENIHKPKAEFFIPIVADQFIREGGTIKVLPTSSQWFGVTYKEDAPDVRKSLRELVSNGEYPEQLWK
jgi:NDP-sugar pyrophosphorylase family protein